MSSSARHVSLCDCRFGLVAGQRHALCPTAEKLEPGYRHDYSESGWRCDGCPLEAPPGKSTGKVYDAMPVGSIMWNPESVQLAITSPPYPNAWSYHLYHQNRILWLGGDPWEFKAQEIGHHRSYSAAGGEGKRTSAGI